MHKNKSLVTILRWLVGIFFIFSGLVKANDPQGLSYKMQEYFDIWGMSSLNDLSMPLAIAMNTLEVLLGVAIILGYAMQLFSWLLLLLILGFTFLTGYSALSGKFKTCGCMGDCLPITPLTSFLKDVLLLGLILIIFFYRKKVWPLVNRTGINIVVLVLTLLFVLFMQLYVLKNLPIVDCLPYKKGNHLLKEMQVAPGATRDSMAIVFQYKKDNKVVEFDADHFPEDFDDSYEYIDRIDKVIRKGNAVPKIEDFALFTLSGEDVTQELLSNNEKQVFVFAQDFTKIRETLPSLRKVTALATQAHIPVYIVSPRADSSIQFLPEGTTQLRIDPVVNKTLARVNPTYFLMQGDLVLEKRSYTQWQDFSKAL